MSEGSHYLKFDVTEEAAVERGKIIAELFNLQPAVTELVLGYEDEQETRFMTDDGLVTYGGLYRVIFQRICERRTV